jgi:hypothetical protein
MQKRVFRLVALLLIAALAGAVCAEAAKEKKPAPPKPTMGASKEIKQLADMTGNWKTATKYKVDPSQPAWTESAGTATYEYVLDSCGIQGRYTGEIMGMPMKGILMLAYHRELKEYQCFWLDNMYGNPILYKGTKDTSGAIVFTTVDKYMGKNVYMRIKQTMPDKRSLVMEFEDSLDGKTYQPSMVIMHSKQ